MFENLQEAKLITFDFETYDPNLKVKGPGTFRGDSYPIGVAIKPNNGPCSYYPIAHETGNIELSKVISYMKEQLNTNIPKCGAHILYDLEQARWLGVKVGGLKYDILVAEPLLDENKYQYNLESLAQQYLGVGKLNEELLKACNERGFAIRKTGDEFNYLHRLDADQVAPYAKRDCELTEQIFAIQREKIAQEDLSQVFMLETELIDLLLEMRFKGVPVDIERAQQVRDELAVKEKELQQGLNSLASYDVQIWAAENISVAFDKANLPYPRTPKTKKPSFTAEWLENHPSQLAKSIVELRKINRLRKDFVEAMVLGSAIKGRIHPLFHSTKHDDGGTGSGRFSSSNPNLQQVPARDPVTGPLVRSLFIPEPGCMWCKRDYSQQEPRLTVHYAFLRNFKGAAEAVRRYCENPDTDYHTWVNDICAIGNRRIAKDINLGLAYGMGVPKMAAKLGKSIEETKELFAKYHVGVPFVKLLSNDAMQVAQTRGYVRTILGRRRHFNLWGPIIYDKNNKHPSLPYEAAKEAYGLPLRRAFTHKALNSIIQGSAADMIKKAMLIQFKAGYVPHLTVHDELNDSIKFEKEAEELKQMMLDAIKLEVPLKVDMTIGNSWGTTK